MHFTERKYLILRMTRILISFFIALLVGNGTIVAQEKKTNTIEAIASYSGPYWATILADTGPPFWSIPGHFIK